MDVYDILGALSDPMPPYQLNGALPHPMHPCQFNGTLQPDTSLLHDILFGTYRSETYHAYYHSFAEVQLIGKG
jgi:hypothetical protein